MHILIIINKPRRNVAFNLFRMSIISLSVIFCKKGNIFLWSLLSVAWDKARQWGKKAKKQGQIGKVWFQATFGGLIAYFGIC